MARTRIRMQFTAVGARARRKLLTNEALEYMDNASAEYADSIVEEVKQYPPPPPGSKYIRTFELYDSWRIRRGRQGANIVYFIENDATDPEGRHYASLVQGPDQLDLHRSTGWKRLDEYVNTSGFRTEIQSIIAEAAYLFGKGF